MDVTKIKKKEILFYMCGKIDGKKIIGKKFRHLTIQTPRLSRVTCMMVLKILMNNGTYTGCLKKMVIKLWSALARSLYNLRKSFFHSRKDQAFSFRMSPFL